MRATLTTWKSWLAMFQTWTMNLCNAEYDFLGMYCCYGDIFRQQYNSRVCHSPGFLFSICYTAFYFPSVMLHLYLQFSRIYMFIFASYQLNFDTGYAVASILHTMQYFWCLQWHLYHTCVAMIWLSRHLPLSLLPMRIKGLGSVTN